MRFKKFVFTSLIISLAISLLSSSLAYAKKCPNPNPGNSPVWRNFQKVLKTDYWDNKVKVKVSEPAEDDARLLNEIAESIIRGHALGRLAVAVQGQPDRRAAFDCVQLALEQENAKAKNDPRAQAVFFRIMMQAAFGMLNKELGIVLKGDLPTEPLHSVFTGKVKTPEPSKGTGGAGGGKTTAGKTTPTTTLKDPTVTGSVSTLGGSSAGGKVASTSASKGVCSNWMTLSFSDTEGKFDRDETEKGCNRTQESGDFHVEFDPDKKACKVCSIDDWTPSSPPPPPPIVTGGGSGTGGTTGSGGTGTGGGSSGKLKCKLDSGYGSVSKDDDEINVLQATKPDKRGFVEFYYIRANRIPFDKNKPPDYDYDRPIKYAREAAKDIVKNGHDGYQFGFATRVGPNGFCNFIESRCDMKRSALKLGNYYCKWY